MLTSTSNIGATPLLDSGICPAFLVPLPCLGFKQYTNTQQRVFTFPTLSDHLF